MTLQIYIEEALLTEHLTNKSIWIEQWPMRKEKKKLQALEQLIQVQLEIQHVEESTSPWNSCLTLKRNWENGECYEI